MQHHCLNSPSDSFNIDRHIQCSDTIGWATGRASGLQKAECWFVGDDALIRVLHVF